MEIDLEEMRLQTEQSFKRNKLLLLAMVAGGALCVCALVWFAPPLSEEERSVIYQIPTTTQELYRLSQVVKNYTESCFNYVVFVFCFLYLLLQSFAIPGPLAFSFLAGALFDLPLGILLVTLCSTFGSVLCYTLSEFLGKGLVVRYCSKPLKEVHRKIYQNKNNIFFYLLFLRLAPLVPNWLINLSSPIIGIPLKHFIPATIIGLIPANCIYINTGKALSSMTEFGISYKSTGFLLLLGVLALIPTFIKKQSKLKF